MNTQSKPTFVLLGHPLLFDNMHVCPFLCLACFVCPRLALSVSMFLACSLYPFCFFLCLVVGFFPCLLHRHVWSEGMTSQVQKKRAKIQVRRSKPKQGNVQQIGGLAFPSGYVLLSPSLSLFSRVSIRVPLTIPLFFFLLFACDAFPGYGNVCFIFPLPCWAIRLEHWQWLIYFPALCCCIVHGVCISMSASIFGDCAVCMMDFYGYVSQPLQL